MMLKQRKFAPAAALLALAVFTVHCGQARTAAPPSQEAAADVAAQDFPRGNLTLINNFTLLWKNHPEFASREERVDQIRADMNRMGDLAADLITQKFTAGKAMQMQADLLAKRADLETRRTGVEGQKTALVTRKVELQAHKQDLINQRDTAARRIEEFQLSRSTATDPERLHFLNEQIADLTLQKGRIEAELTSLDPGMKQLNDGIAQLDGGLAQLAGGEAQIDAGLGQIRAKLNEAGQAIARHRQADIPAVADAFAEPSAVVLEFDAAGNPSVSILGWTAGGELPRDYSSKAGTITDVSYQEHGGVFRFKIDTGSGVYSFVLSRSRYELAQQGLVAFHGDLTAVLPDGTARGGMAKFMGVL